MSGRFGIVTGAGSGIGRAVTLALAGAGWTLALAGRRREKLDSVAEAIRQSGGSALCIETDVSDAVAVERLFTQAVGAFGRLDLLFTRASSRRRCRSTR